MDEVSAMCRVDSIAKGFGVVNRLGSIDEVPVLPVLRLDIPVLGASAFDSLDTMIANHDPLF